MRFGKAGAVVDKTTIIYNNSLTLRGIPLEAYEYQVNGKSAIEWLMDRYQRKIDRDSKITNDPNDWAAEVGDERYVVDLIKRVVRVSVETVRIVNDLPPLAIDVGSIEVPSAADKGRRPFEIVDPDDSHRWVTCLVEP